MLFVEAYEADVWQYIKSQPAIRLTEAQGEPSAEGAVSLTDDVASPPPTTQTKERAGTEEAEDDGRMTIKVRNGPKEELEMVVRPKTTAGAIVRQYIKAMSDERLTDAEIRERAKRCRLEFDGEHLGAESRVQDTEIEDGEVLDLVIG